LDLTLNLKKSSIQLIQTGILRKIVCSLSINLFLRETWFNFDENKKTTADCYQTIHYDWTQDNIPIRFSIPSELITRNHGDAEWRPTFIDTLNPIVHAIQFTTLYISCRNLVVGTLVKIIGLLPNLDSIQVLDSPLQQFSSVLDEDAKRFRAVSNSNRITKVWQLMNFEQTKFLINLCRLMEHLEVHNVKEEDLEMLVRFILMKIITHIKHLRLLHLYVLDANDAMIHKLRTMIDSERLICDYIIKRFGNEITLQRKL
jgi:hypothetical protein